MDVQKYNSLEVEKKWQTKWEKTGLHNVNLKNAKKKYYNLVMFPYPSGDKLHVGHWYNFGPADSYGRYLRMQGHNVLEPMGFDSFGLPAENYAIKSGVHPKKSTEKNIEYMIKQLKRMGTIYDWDKSVVTSRPEYYKWTQWIFLQLYKNGLAYKRKAPVNWCPSCQTVLANEQVQDGTCDRCHTEVTKKDLSQWFFNIRKYAEQLLDHSGLDWPEKTLTMQRNWIGKSIGCDVSWKVKDQDLILDTFTTTVDTIYGVTFAVISPEHPDLDKLVKPKFKKDVEKYIESAKKKSDIERLAEDKEKTGVNTGSFLVNPFNGQEVPLWVADYVLMTYGTGVVMGVPAHDQRDMDFAKKYEFEIVQSVQLDNGETFVYDDVDKYNVKGKIIDSGEFTGLSILDGRKKMIKWMEKNKCGKAKIQYKLRDWLISRQRYWGAPIPIVYCKKCGEVAAPEKDLPIELPDDVDFKPTGESPLSKHDKFKNTKCPKCGGKAEREVDTMDTFMCSSWYFLRYPCNALKTAAFDKKTVNTWLPVDMYIGGPEHACMHLLYARFINMALYDLGYIGFKEPFKRLVHQGMVTKDGAKMSKSKGNTVSPDEFVDKYGSDVFRMYLMFMGPFTEGGDWNDKGITGVARFLDRFWNMINDEKPVQDADALKRALNKLIKKVGEDIEIFHFNTAVSSLMEFVNFVFKNGIDKESKKIAVRLIAPLAPHFAEECHEVLGGKYSVMDNGWPKFDPKYVVDETVKIGVQVNGKVRGDVSINKDAPQAEAIKLAKENPNVAKYLAEGKIVKEIYVPGRIIGFVVK
ncbi:MAG: leucine--tRNA ligase [Candidatus Gracilibacteria bacterium]|jgi:leucyl-tRNA synthetase